MSSVEPIPRYVTALSWPYVGNKLSLAQECATLVANAAKDHPPPYGFDLVVSSARNINGWVLLIVVDLGYEGAPAYYDSDFFSPISSWLLHHVGKQWQDRDVLHIVNTPLNEYFSELKVWSSIHVNGPGAVPNKERSFKALLGLFDPATATENSMQVHVGMGAQYAIIHRELLSTIVDAMEQTRVEERSVLGLSEGVLFSPGMMATGNLGVFRLHCSRSRLLHCAASDKVEPLLSGEIDQLGFEPYVLFMRWPCSLDDSFFRQELSRKSLAGLIALWQCPDHYSSPNNYIYLSRELLLILSVFLDVHNRTYRWSGRQVRLDPEEMEKLGFTEMAETQ